MFRFLENLINPYADYAQDDTPPRKVWPFLWSYLKGMKNLFLLTAVLSIIVAGFEIGLLAYMGRLIDLLGASSPATFLADHGVEMAIAVILILFIRPILFVLDVAILNNAILPNVGAIVRYRAHKHVLKQSVGWFENDFAGRIANRIMQTPPAAGEVVFQAFDAITFSVAYFIGAGIMLWGTDPRLLLPLVGWILAYGGLVVWTVRRIGPAAKASSDARSALTGRVVDSYTNIHSVKMFSHHDAELEYGIEAIEKARTTFQKEMRIFTLMDVGLLILNGILIVSVVGWAVYLWMIGETTVGLVAAATALTLRLNAMTGWIMWALTNFFQNLGIVAEGLETISEPITLRDKPNAAKLKLTTGTISIENLTHHYGRKSGGLQDVSLTIAPGEKIGLVGRSGAGKSTLIKLLLRFYDAESGSIKIDGQNISDVTQHSLRQQIGVVQQDSSLLHRSIFDNIAYGRPGATLTEVTEAAEQAEALEFIQDLEDREGNKGFDAQVGERGVKLSGGQRQRVALARVILKSAPILVLDEATSALDSEVEAAIQETLYEMMAGRTVIAVAHRLSTIARLDRILVMDDGRIIEEGSHDELLAKNGAYAGFWARQSGGFINTDD